MSPDLIWLMIVANATIAVVTIANTWALAWYNKKQAEAGETQIEHEKHKAAERRIKRGVILPATLTLLLSIAGIVLSTLTPANDVTTQILHISGFIGAAVLSVVFVLFGYFISIFSSHVSSTKQLVGIVGQLRKLLENRKQTDES